MNWETFKTLTKEQKEEYKYKFMDKPKLSIYPIIILTMMFCLVLIILLFVSYIIMTSNNENLILLHDKVQNLFALGAELGHIALVLIVCYVLYDAGNLFFYVANEYWWRKKHHIKYKYASWMEQTWSWINKLILK